MATATDETAAPVPQLRALATPEEPEMLAPESRAPRAAAEPRVAAEQRTERALAKRDWQSRRTAIRVRQHDLGLGAA